MERLKFATVAGSLKIVGVLASVGGAMVINLYKGNELHLWRSILQYHKNELTEVASNHVRGTILLVISILAYACWYLIQTEVNKVYPYKYSSSMATCLVGGFVTAFVGVVVRRDGDAWKLGWNLKLLTVVYSVSHQIISAGGTETKCFAKSRKDKVRNWTHYSKI